MPRKKAESVHTEVVKGMVVDASPLPPQNADDLVAEHFRNDDWLTAEQKRFSEHIKPILDRQEAIKNLLMEKLNADGLENIKTQHGTAYKSRILNTKIDAEAEPYVRQNSPTDIEEFRGREAILEFCLDHWPDIGNEMLQIGVTKDAVKAWIEANGKPPPGVSTSTFTRINIRRS